MIVRMLNYMDVETKALEKVALADLNQINPYAKEAVKFLATQDVLVSG